MIKKFLCGGGSFITLPVLGPAMDGDTMTGIGTDLVATGGREGGGSMVQAVDTIEDGGNREGGGSMVAVGSQGVCDCSSDGEDTDVGIAELGGVRMMSP